KQSFFFQAEASIRAATVTGVQTCALPISAGVEHPLLEPERRALAEIDDVGGDARRKRLELLVPFAHQPQLVEAGEHPDRGHLIELAGRQQNHTAMTIVPDALGAQDRKSVV